MQIVRVPFDRLAETPQDQIDPCSFDPRGAVLLLTEQEVAALTVPFERLGALPDFVRRFRPAKTMATVGVPSIARLLGEPIGPAAPPGSAAGFLPLSYDRYHTPQEGIDFFWSLAVLFPDRARLESIGHSVEGRDLWALRISDNPLAEETIEQKILFCALHHAREWAAHEVVLYLAEYLLTRYDTDPRVRNIVDHSVVWIVLDVNPDGFQYSWDTDRFWRKNRRRNRDGSYGVDLNRNYAYLWGYNDGGSSPAPTSATFRGLSPASEPETQAVQDFLAREKPAIAVTYHTYSQLVLYPWGYSPFTLPQAYTSLRAIGQQYAQCANAMHGTHYTPGPLNYTLYPTNGDFTDYAYGAHGILAYTPELRPISSDEGGFLLPEDQILPNCEENLAAALWLMDNVADARRVAPPERFFLTEGMNPLSLPLPPVNQKPGAALAMSAAAASRLSTWFDDAGHLEGFGHYPQSFEGIGAGSPYFLDSAPASAEWAQRFGGYQALPYIFDGGAAIMLENVFPGVNYVGLPSEHPVPMRDLKIVKRRLHPRGTEYGRVEVTLETRTALEDLQHASPWISWQWTSTAGDGSARTAHPEGEAGAEELLYPFRVYSFDSNVRSYTYAGVTANDAVYMLVFPAPASRDVDATGEVDKADFRVLLDCLGGPGAMVFPSSCRPFDSDHDREVTLRDVAAFQNDFGRVVGCAP